MNFNTFVAAALASGSMVVLSRPIYSQRYRRDLAKFNIHDSQTFELTRVVLSRTDLKDRRHETGEIKEKYRLHEKFDDEKKNCHEKHKHHKSRSEEDEKERRKEHYKKGEEERRKEGMEHKGEHEKHGKKKYGKKAKSADVSQRP